MFQNIQNDFEDNKQEVKDVKTNKKEIVKRIFTKQNIALYIISFMVSTVGFGTEFAPFGLSILAAACSNHIPIGLLYVITAIGTLIGFGTNSFLIYVISGLLFILLQLWIKPKVMLTDVNEKRKVGMHLFFSSLFVQLGSILLREFYVYDILSCVMLSIMITIFYKIFANSLIVIKEYGIKKAFSIEEVIGASLLIAIAIGALKETAIFGFSLRNILSILVVLILGWKNGILVGATSGITVGVVLGMIQNAEPIIIASYALSGMIAGVLNKLGKIGVIAGFIIGNVLLTYVANGNVVPIILLREILIASLGLLAVPKGAVIDIEDLFGKTRLLPNGPEHTLEENQSTIYKLNTIAETISEVAKTYKEVAATTLEENDMQKGHKEKDTFVQELKNNLEGLEDNILYEDIVLEENGIIEDIYATIRNKGEIQNQDIIAIFAKYNNYIIGFETDFRNEVAMQDISEMVKAINHTYKITNLNAAWKRKMKESKINTSEQLENVSRAIDTIAETILPNENEKKENILDKKKEEIKLLLKQKNIIVKDIQYTKEKSGRNKIELYTKSCQDVDNIDCNIEKIEKLISKVMKEKMTIKNQICGIKTKEDTCKYTLLSQDQYSVQIGMAKATKAKSNMSGDTSLQTRLEDGKYLIAISDGMGSRRRS